MTEYYIRPIGYVKNDRKEPEDDYWGDVISEITLDKTIPTEAFEGIGQFSHLEILFYFHRVKESKIVSGKAHPRNNKEWPEVGIFCQRRKGRPNLLGLTVVELISVRERSITVEGLDAIDETPVIDIKPFTRNFIPSGEIKQPWWIDEMMKNYWK